MLKRLLVIALLGLGATQAMATTLTITAQGTVDTAIAGIGTEVGDSFSLTATVSEPAFFESIGTFDSLSLFQIETLTAVIGPSTLSLITPTTSAFLEVNVNTRLGTPSSRVNLLMNSGTFSSPAGTFFGTFGAVWVFDQAIGRSFADLVALDFTQATQASFGASDARTQSTGLGGAITAESFTVPAAIPLPAAGWLLLAALGGLGLARRNSQA